MIWPGYITVVDEYEGGLYLQVDVANRVLRTETVMDIFKKVKKTDLFVLQKFFKIIANSKKFFSEFFGHAMSHFK